MTTAALCLWCEKPLPAGGRRGSARKFCDRLCRYAFHSAARRWVAQAIEAGLISSEDLRTASTKACTPRLGPPDIFSGTPGTAEEPQPAAPAGSKGDG